jgi:hypothetical protein
MTSNLASDEIAQHAVDLREEAEEAGAVCTNVFIRIFTNRSER